MTNNSLNTIQPGMWATAHQDATDAWQIASRHMAMLEQIARHPELAELLDEAMMALADGVPGGPFTAATDALRGARGRHLHRQQAERQDSGPRQGGGGHAGQLPAATGGNGQPTAQFTAAAHVVHEGNGAM